jgi:ribosome-associated toxin RatA of RatAB toxin-antitoxin module
MFTPENRKLLTAYACIVMMAVSLLFRTANAASVKESKEDIPTAEQTRLLNGEVIVNTTALDDGVTGVTGKIFIDAPPEYIWQTITDYDNQKHFVPKVIDSGMISDNGDEQVMFETGRTGVLFFRKTVYIKLRVRGEPLRRLAFQQLEGDFKVYRGEWLIENAPNGKGAMLTFRAEIKPGFFAPSYFVRNVQQKDLPMVLDAMKKRAESKGSIGKSENKRSSEPS